MNTRTIIAVILCTVIARVTFAVTCTSAINGLWQSPATWSTNSIPVPGDTVVLKHTVTSNADLTISNIYVTVDSTGILCCKSNLELMNYTYVLNYGLIYAYRLLIHSYAHFKNRGFFDVYGGGVHINDFGSLHNDSGYGIVHISSASCCIDTIGYFDNIKPKFRYHINANRFVDLYVENPIALNYTWKFSNGYKTGTSVSHQFPDYGKNPVTLVEYDSCMLNYYTDTIYIVEPLPPVFNVYYSITSNEVFISIENSAFDNVETQCMLYDYTGRKILETTVNLNSSNNFKANFLLPDLAPSGYIVKCNYRNYNITKAVKIISGIK